MKYAEGEATRTLLRRTPQGVRGLKYFDDRLMQPIRSSHPARGAWIEIVPARYPDDHVLVAPRKGCVD